jgi:SAM-dependent methyltransferase
MICMTELGADGGWTASANAWIALAPEHATRTLLLDPAVLAECGDLQGKRVLDAGCGEGRFCRILASHGAEAVGLDPIAPLLDSARGQASASERYVLGAGERLPFQDASFDLVVFYLSLIDITGYREAINDAYRVLRPGGKLIAANMSNIASATEKPAFDEDGRFIHYAVSQYKDDFAMTLEWAGLRIRNWHRPLSAYMDAYLSAGFILRRFLEPAPQDESLRDDIRYESWFRVPTFDLQVWQKPAA